MGPVSWQAERNIPRNKRLRSRFWSLDAKNMLFSLAFNTYNIHEPIFVTQHLNLGIWEVRPHRCRGWSYSEDAAFLLNGRKASTLYV
jgi:hypothetical protein